MKTTHRIMLGVGCLLLVAAFVTVAGSRPAPDRPLTKVAELQSRAADYAAAAESARDNGLYRDLKGRTTGAQARLNADRDIELMGVDRNGLPRFYRVQNLNAARTISTDDVWAGGSAGFSLDGANTTGELIVWDAGAVLTSHQEFGGRVTIGDGTVTTHYHATHVAGTLVASGVDPLAIGMSHAANLVSYDWTNDESEMAAAAAAGMLVSNHSYGYTAGWSQSGTDPYDWYWYGDVNLSENEDNGFGFYYDNARDMDQITYNAPYYLICKSAGNDRNDSGPSVGEGHWYWNPSLGDWEWSTVTRAADGGATGYDTVPYGGTAKNILCVGAVYDIAAGYTYPSDVAMSSFSGWGPTDDGRIKPDIVANGISLRSSMDDADNSYAGLSGTSMASPNAAGSAHLVAQYYRSSHDNQKALSSTLRALLIHTADEAGTNPGPDYSFGWGLMNTRAAIETVQDDSTDTERIVEDTLANGDTDTLRFYCDGTGPFGVTIAWTDPAGTVPGWSLDPTTPNLVNDLDLKVYRESDSTLFSPWILDPANPANAATNGDNTRDNVEQVRIDSPTPGWYSVQISHKGNIGSGQAYSVIQSGSTEAPPAFSIPYTDDFSADAGWVATHPSDFSIASTTLNWHVDRAYEQKFYLNLNPYTGDFTHEGDVFLISSTGDFQFISGLANSLSGGTSPTDYEGVFVMISGFDSAVWLSVLQVSGADTYQSALIPFTTGKLNHFELQVVGGEYKLTVFETGTEVDSVTGTLGYPVGAYSYIAIGGPGNSDTPTADGIFDNLVVTDVTTWTPGASAPTVTNVEFAQRTDGSGIVDVVYDLEDGDSATVTVTFEASSDSGATWDLVTTTVSGDIGTEVVPGVGKTIEWDFAADNPGLFLPDCVVRVTAEDGTP